MNFDLLAPHYRWMEFVLAGDKLQRCRTRFLDQIPAARYILILGEGNGRFLVECRRKLADARITCVDASAKMLEQARRRLESHELNPDGVEFIHADALAWNPPETAFDLIVTNFFLDCFRADQLEPLIARISNAAGNRAAWLLADFCSPGCGAGRFRAELILRTMYLFFRAVTRLPARELTPPDAFLGRHGFMLRQRSVTEWGLLHSDWWERGGHLAEPCWSRQPKTAPRRTP